MKRVPARGSGVIALIVTGRLNNQVGYALGVSDITVKTHRAKMMRKMKADPFAGLGCMAPRVVSHSAGVTLRVDTNLPAR